MLDRRGSVLDGSIVAGERMIVRCDYRSFKMDSEQCLNFWLSPVMWKMRGSYRSPPCYLSCANYVTDGDLYASWGNEEGKDIVRPELTGLHHLICLLQPGFILHGRYYAWAPLFIQAIAPVEERGEIGWLLTIWLQFSVLCSVLLLISSMMLCELLTLLHFWLTVYFWLTWAMKDLFRSAARGSDLLCCFLWFHFLLLLYKWLATLLGPRWRWRWLGGWLGGRWSPIWSSSGGARSDLRLDVTDMV
jgi:hypothetical protein